MISFIINVLLFHQLIHLCIYLNNSKIHWHALLLCWDCILLPLKSNDQQSDLVLLILLWYLGPTYLSIVYLIHSVEYLLLWEPSAWKLQELTLVYKIFQIFHYFWQAARIYWLRQLFILKQESSINFKNF